MRWDRDFLPLPMFPKKGIRHYLHGLAADHGGMALLMTLAAISFLIAVTVDLATSVNRQIQASHGLRESVRMDEALVSGLNLVRASLFADQRKQHFDTLLDGWNTPDKEALASLFAGMQLSIRVQDMSGRIQINSLVAVRNNHHKPGLGSGRQPGSRVPGQVNGKDSEKLQRGLWIRFLLSGKFNVNGQQEAEALIDALSDWLDEDDTERDHGAESGYYQTLKTPYVCRNGPLQYPEELLLVKGFTRKLVYGDKEHEGIIDYLTIYGQDGKININTAPSLVLQVLAPGVDEDMVGALVAFRREKENLSALKNPQWYRHAPDFPGDIVFDNNLVTTISSYFMVTITADINGFEQTGTGFLYRNPQTKEQDLLSWRVD